MNLERRPAQIRLAQRYLNKTIDRIWEQEEKLLLSHPYLMGIKNTEHIKQEWINTLESLFLPHTLDRMAYKGRAIDPELSNPLTLRAMTGSSSGTAINVLMGINDLGLGTDGGGSVIYPALSVNIYSVMLAGVGFCSETCKVSTDQIPFTPSLGLMSFDSDILHKALSLLIPKTSVTEDYAIAGDSESMEFFSKKGSIIKIPDTDNRPILIEFTNEILLSHDILLIKEKHIDLYAYGDSVLGTSSPYFTEQQLHSQKKLGKILNMIGASVFTVPDREAASGYLIIARHGIEAFQKAWEIFLSISDQRSPLFKEYFGISL